MKNIAIYKTKFGNIKIIEENNKIISLKKTDENSKNKNQKTFITDLAFTQLEEYFRGERKKFDLPYKLHGTDFQLKVWNALLNIPYGKTRTYKEIAITIENPKASRAVGLANNKNPIAIIVPCHRVIGSNGYLTGYAYGIEMKRQLLKIERNLAII